MTAIFEEMTDRVAAGASLDGRDIDALWSTHDLVRLGMLADDVRRRRFGTTVTYVRVADLRVDELGTADVLANAGECRVVAPAGQLLSNLDAIATLVKRAGAVPVTAGHLEEFVALGRECGPALRSLAGVGVSGLAYAAVDRLPQAEQAVATALESGLPIARFVVERATGASPWPVLERVRAVQRATGAVRAFAPLPRHHDDSLPTTGYTDVKVVALARLALADVERIQVDWARYGAKLSQVALVFGANDIDTALEAEGAAAGWRRAADQELMRNILAASMTPLERDGRFASRTTRIPQRWASDVAMSPVRVGAVGYLNAKPLVFRIEARRAFTVRYDVPSRCATLLHDGEVDIGLIPSIEYLRGRAYTIAPGISIASKGPVASVALYSRVPVDRVRRIALDTSSRTSVALLRVLCAERFGIAPDFAPAEPQLEQMLKTHDAALLIGDPALFTNHERLGLLKTDLGAAWTEHTGLPFVWAFWAGDASALGEDVCRDLADVRDAGVAALDRIAREHGGDDAALTACIADYLQQNIHWTLTASHEAALHRFYGSAARLGLVSWNGEVRFAGRAKSGVVSS